MWRCGVVMVVSVPWRVAVAVVDSPLARSDNLGLVGLIMSSCPRGWNVYGSL